MIITRLAGGLGNQMFQYALGRHLALINETNLTLDISGFSQFPDRCYALQHFSIRANIANSEVLKKLAMVKNPKKDLLQRLFTSDFLYVRQAGFNYNYRSDVIKKYNKHVYLDGDWQSEKYFLAIKDVIKHEFSLDYLFIDTNPAVLDAMEITNSVSVHVRRGDYVSNDISNEFHGLCSLSYYKQAFDYIYTHIENPHFFLFSDDIEWCKNEMSFSDNITFVENPGPLQVYRDLYLMTKCKHHIIANSSFSWWGAWLGKNKDSEIVVAPEEWFNRKSRWHNEHLFSTEDIVPKQWVRL